MNNASQMTTAAKRWMSIITLSLILLPSAAMAENEGGTGSSTTGGRDVGARFAELLRPVTDWFHAGFDSLGSYTGSGEARDGAGEPRREAAQGSGEPQRGAGSGTGKPQRGAGNGTGGK